MPYRELEMEDFQLALKWLHSPAPNAKEEILKLVEKYNAPLTKQSSVSSLGDSPIKTVAAKKTAIISETDSETDVEDDDNSVGNDSTSGNACYVCKNSEVSLNNDSLMKCHDCNIHCHRECHKPSISKTEYDDPRFIWYCTKCNKTVKKGASTSSKSTVKSSLSKSSVSSSSISNLSNSSAGMKRKPDAVTRKPGSSYNPSSSAAPIGKPNPTNLSIVQQRIANRKAKK